MRASKNISIASCSVENDSLQITKVCHAIVHDRSGQQHPTGWIDFFLCSLICEGDPFKVTSRKATIMPHPDVFTVLVTASNRNHNQDRYEYHNYAITNYYHCSCEVMDEPPSAEPTLQMWRMLTVQRSQCTRNRSTHLVVLTISKQCFTKLS